jgi:prepilin-type N-terminal cleavage/methylation domain-containing protein
MKNFRKMCRGQKGFTLIELLVVIIILGVLAAVVTLAVTRFIGKGTLEAANAELVTVQAAIESCLAEANSGSLTSAVAAWSGADGAIGVSPGVDSPAGGDVEFKVYDQMRTHKLKAAYAIDIDGNVTGATCAAAGQWGATKIQWNATDDVWEKYVAPAP